MQIYPNTPPPPALTVSPSLRTIAGFWRRLLAFAIDSIITSLPCFLLGLLFYRFLSVSAVYEVWTGFVLIVLYFAVFDSNLSQGQTLGQRMMKIQVVNQSGEPVSLERSLLRSLILLTPLLVSSQILPSAVPSILKAGFDWLIFAAEAAIFYLYIFNSRTRQSLHDLAVGTYVVDAQPQGVVESQRYWRGHWAILAGIAIACALLATQLANEVRHTSFPELTQIQRAVLDSGKAKSAGVVVQKNWRGGEARTGLVVTVLWNGKRSDTERDATEIADIILRADSHAADRDFITVVFQRGFVVGFARFSANQPVSHDPTTWITQAKNFGFR